MLAGTLCRALACPVLWLGAGWRAHVAPHQRCQPVAAVHVTTKAKMALVTTSCSCMSSNCAVAPSDRIFEAPAPVPFMNGGGGWGGVCGGGGAGLPPGCSSRRGEAHARGKVLFSQPMPSCHERAPVVRVCMHAAHTCTTHHACARRMCAHIGSEEALHLRTSGLHMHTNTNTHVHAYGVAHAWPSQLKPAPDIHVASASTPSHIMTTRD